MNNDNNSLKSCCRCTDCKVEKPVSKIIERNLFRTIPIDDKTGTQIHNIIMALWNSSRIFLVKPNGNRITILSVMAHFPAVQLSTSETVRTFLDNPENIKPYSHIGYYE